MCTHILSYYAELKDVFLYSYVTILSLSFTDFYFFLFILIFSKFPAITKEKNNSFRNELEMQTSLNCHFKNKII